MEALNELALFAGIGGGILGGKLLGWRTVCAVENQPYPVSILIQRQNEGVLPPLPIWDDIRTFDGKPWAGYVDVVSGGFPCQDISMGGKKRGLAGERSGLWREMARIIDEVRPRYAFVENSPLLTNNGLERVLSNLAEIGYDAEWCCLGGAEIGAIHKRERFWLLGFDPNRINAPLHGESFHLEAAIRQITKTKQLGKRWLSELVPRDGGLRTDAYPRVMREANAIPCGLDRLKALGNAQIPCVAATAWNLLQERISNRY